MESTYQGVPDNFSSFYDFPIGGNFSFTGFNEDDSFKNILEQYRASLFTFHDTTTIVLLALYIPILLVSVIGNILVLVVIAPNKQLQSVTNNFLLNLALADLLVSLVCIPMTAAQRVYKLWIYGDVLCRATPYLQGIAVSASTFTITAMSLDRCLAIRHPVSFRRLRTTKTVRILILFVWLISLIIMVPILLVRRTVTDEILPGAKFTYCIEVWTSQIHRQAYDIFILFIVYMCPGILIATCYTLMGQRLWVPDKQLNNKTMLKDGGNKHITSGRRRLAKMCIGVAVMFAVCWLPYYIVNTYLNFKSDIVAANIVHFMLLVGHFHSATNPVLYCFLHKTFRRYLKRFLASCFKIKLGEHSRLLSKGIFSQPNATTKSFKCSYKSSVRNSRIPATSPKYPQSATLCPPTGNIHSDNSSDVRFQHSFISGTNDPSDTDNSSSVAAEVMTLSTVPSKKEVRHVSLSINGKLYETSDRLSDDSS